jgi:hypothetical protein
MSCEIGWFIYNVKIEVVSFVTSYGRKLAIGVIFEVKGQRSDTEEAVSVVSGFPNLWGTLMECS